MWILLQRWSHVCPPALALAQALAQAPAPVRTLSLEHSSHHFCATPSVFAGVVLGPGTALGQGRARTAGGKCWRLPDLETAGPGDCLAWPSVTRKRGF